MLASWVKFFTSIDGPSLVRVVVWVILGVMAVVSYVFDMRRDRQLQSKTDKIETKTEKIEANTNKAVGELLPDHGESLKDQMGKVLEMTEAAVKEAEKAKLEVERLMAGLQKEFHRLVVHELRNTLNHSKLVEEAQRYLKEEEGGDHPEGQ